MTEAVHIFVPLFAFMLIPVWIPLIAATAGGVRDLFRPREEHPITVARRTRQERAHATRVRVSDVALDVA